MARRESQKGTQTLKVKPKITQNPNYQNLLEHSWKKQKKNRNKFDWVTQNDDSAQHTKNCCQTAATF